jgi:Zn-dependent peptidase ImmA (M78 family)
MSREKPDYKNAERESLYLLDQFSYKNPLVNPVEIAKGLGIRVDFATMKEEKDKADVSGFFDPTNNAIVVNVEQQTSRQLFTVAHELGHKVLHTDWLNQSNEILYRSSYVSRDWREQEANFFAANLLLPKFMMDRYQKKYGLDEKYLDIWAGIFGVSREFMLNRWRFLYGK